jgi:DMSO/TMAO reductase YedYZ molybdopterin-dependent catalytic subunit
MLDALARPTIGQVMHVLGRWFDWNDLPPSLFDKLGLIRFTGEIAQPEVLTIGELKGLQALTQTVTYTSGGAPVTDTFTGVLLTDVIARAGGATTDPTAKNDILAHYVVATGSDGYRAVFSMGELDPRFGGEPVLVAYDDALGQLGPGGSDGFARMVVPGDTAGGRYVSNLVRLEVVDIDLGPAASDQIWG